MTSDTFTNVILTFIFLWMIVSELNNTPAEVVALLRRICTAVEVMEKRGRKQ